MTTVAYPIRRDGLMNKYIICPHCANQEKGASEEGRVIHQVMDERIVGQSRD
jgi:hypothetical protein